MKRQSKSIVDIIIVTYNAGKMLDACLKSVFRWTPKGQYRLMVVDNASTDATRLLAARYRKKSVQWIRTRKNLGFSGGANVGLRNSNGRFIIFLDDDAKVTKGWFEGLLKAVRQNPSVAIAGCKIKYPNGRIFNAEYRAYPDIVPVGRHEIDRGQRDYERTCDALVGTCWIMKRALLKAVGYFDETFYPSQWEDIDYCLRTRLAGYRIVYTGQCSVTHYTLYRAGNSKDRARTEQAFLKKWKTKIKKFPLPDTHPCDKHIFQANRFVERKDFARAAKEFNRIPKNFRASIDPYYYGLMLEAAGKMKQAAEYYEQVIRRGSNREAALRVALSRIYQQQGKLKVGEREIQKAILSFSKEKGRHTSALL